MKGRRVVSSKKDPKGPRFCTIFICLLCLVKYHKLTRSKPARSFVISFTRHNAWIKIVRAHQPWSNLYVFYLLYIVFSVILQLAIINTRPHKLLSFKYHRVWMKVLLLLLLLLLLRLWTDPTTLCQLMLQWYQTNAQSLVFTRMNILFYLNF